MKILDPQSALLTTAEVHEFFKTQKPVKEDRAQGAYKIVNRRNYESVRNDIKHYISTVHPHIISSSLATNYMDEVVPQLKRHGLTKTEVMTLINLGVGTNKPSSSSSAAAATIDSNGDVIMSPKDGDDNDDDAEEESEEVQENGLDRALFSLVVEESDERFAGEEGEKKIEEIMQILKHGIQRPTETEISTINGHEGGENGDG